MKVPSVASKYGIPAIGQNTCVGLLFGRSFFKTFPDGPRGLTSIEACMVGMNLADDLGIWENYGQMQRDFQKFYYSGVMKENSAPKNSRAIHGTSMRKGIRLSCLNYCPRLPVKTGTCYRARTGDRLSPGAMGYTGTRLATGSGYSLLENGASQTPCKRRRRTMRGNHQHPA